MNARFRSSMALLVVLTTFAAAFAPAPIFREPPKSTPTSVFAALQGKWRVSNTTTKSTRLMGLRIQDKTWTYTSTGPDGATRDGASYEILLDASRRPMTLDLKRGPNSRLMLKGIIKIEGDCVIFCYTITDNEGDRPTAFTDTNTPMGKRVLTKTLTRTE